MKTSQSFVNRVKEIRNSTGMLLGDAVKKADELYNRDGSVKLIGATPTPWKVSQTGKFVMHSKPGTVLNVCEASIEDAEFIVRAVNSHEELLQLAKDYAAIHAVNGCDCVDGQLCLIHRQIQKAIAKAERKGE